MTTAEKQKQIQRAYQSAVKLNDQEWLDSGKTQQQLDQEQELVILFDNLLASGRSQTDILDEWENLNTEAILCRYIPGYKYIPADKSGLNGTGRLPRTPLSE